jgi:DNA modification methylase
MTLDRNHVYNMNCLDGIRQMIAQDMRVDCVITDPPYLIDYKTHRRQQTNIAATTPTKYGTS